MSLSAQQFEGFLTCLNFNIFKSRKQTLNIIKNIKYFITFYRVEILFRIT